MHPLLRVNSYQRGLLVKHSIKLMSHCLVDAKRVSLLDAHPIWLFQILSEDQHQLSSVKCFHHLSTKTFKFVLCRKNFLKRFFSLQKIRALCVTILTNFNLIIIFLKSFLPLGFWDRRDLRRERSGFPPNPNAPNERSEN